MAEPTFEDQMFLGSEAVYARIVDPTQPPFDVEAALMDAQAQASDNEQQ